MRKRKMKYYLILSILVISTSTNVYSQSDWVIADSVSLEEFGGGITSLFNVDENTWWLTANSLYYNSSKLLRSTDRGTSWEREYTSIDGRLYGLHFDSVNCYIIKSGDAEKIYKSTNGGDTFHYNSTIDDSQYAYFMDACFLNSAVGWCLVQVCDQSYNYFGRLYKTTDSSDTWNLVNEFDYYNFYQIGHLTFFNEEIGLITGQYGQIGRTTDGGLTWDWVDVALGQIHSIFISGESAAFTAGYSGEIWKTTNKGETWTLQNSNTLTTLRALTFPDENIGYAVGNAGKIIKTVNGGADWFEQNSPTNKVLTKVCAFDENLVLAAGGDRYDPVLIRTTNGGGITNIWELSENLSFQLFQNYPNPFNPATKIKYQIAKDKNQNSNFVSLKVFDILGREVATLVNKAQPPGEYEVEFNAGNLTSGIYFYQLKAGEFLETKKMVFIR